jgi:hypothetical protein
MNAEQLRRKIRNSLRKQGFRVTREGVSLPASADKSTVRKLHATAVQHHREESEKRFAPLEEQLISQVANGRDVRVHDIRPRLIEVTSGSDDELLFRYAALHWAVPISAGYGRRMRFVIKDESNDKLIGIIGLCDPVISIRSRDEWIGWSTETRLQRLRHVMDAFVLGAVPPYSALLGGKLVALLAISNEIRDCFRQKYSGTVSLIRKSKFDGNLALVTTMSALGRSSVYNRLKFQNDIAFKPLGFSKGSGEFHFTNGLYADISDYAKRYCEPSYRKSEWGEGFRNRREVVRKCLRKIKLTTSWGYHGVERELYAAPLASNTEKFLRGEDSRLIFYDRPAQEIADYAIRRWMAPRALRDSSYMSFSKDEYRLYAGKNP